MPDVLRALRLGSLPLLLLLSLSLYGCTLFDDVLPPGALSPNNQPNNTNNAPLTCQNAACTDDSAWRCQGSSRQQCADAPDNACLLWTRRQDCATTSAKALSTRQDIPNAATSASNSTLIAGARVFARDDELLSLRETSITRQTIEQGAISALVTNNTTLIAITQDHQALELDAQLKLTQTYPAPPGATASAIAKAQSGDIYWAQGNRLRSSRAAVDIQLGMSDQIRAIAIGQEAQAEVLYVATNRALLKINPNTGQTITQSSALDGAPLSVIAENGGAWVLVQRALLRFEGEDFSTPALTVNDALCGTGIEMRAEAGALWMTDVAGCLSRYDLATKQLHPKTIDLNNRTGGPATSNYRPHAPVISRGVGYAVARTTELVAFNPTSMEEFKRQLTPAGEPLSRIELLEDGALLLQGKTQGVILEPHCPCQ